MQLDLLTFAIRFGVQRFGYQMKWHVNRPWMLCTFQS